MSVITRKEATMQILEGLALLGANRVTVDPTTWRIIDVSYSEQDEEQDFVKAVAERINSPAIPQNPKEYPKDPTHTVISMYAVQTTYTPVP